MRLLIQTAFSCCVLCCTAAALASNTFYVSPAGNDSNAGTQGSPLQTIQAAINKAVSGDTVSLENGTYSGAGNVDLSLSNTTLNFTSVGGAANAIVDASGGHGFIGMAKVGNLGAPATLAGITIKNSGITPISLNTTYIAVSQCVFSGTVGGGAEGGAIYSDGASDLEVYNTSFLGDMSPLAGGAVFTAGQSQFRGCTFNGNSSGEDGGAITNAGTASIVNCSFIDNDSAAYGCVQCAGGTTTVQQCTFRGNTGGSISGSGKVTVFGTIFENNSDASQHGGAALRVVAGDTAVSSCVIVGNQADHGGAIYNNAALTLQGCTLEGNSATGSSGGGAIYVGGGATQTIITDDILWADTAPSAAAGLGEIAVAAGGVQSVQYCDVDGGYTGLVCLDADPLFVSAAAGDYLLQAGSPCIHAGIVVSGMTTDYGGKTRFVPPTMGAYEFGANWSVVGSVTDSLNNKRILWVSDTGQAWLWKITPTGSASMVKYGPNTGYTPVALAVGPDNDPYIVWQYNAGGIVTWNLTPSGVKAAHYSVPSNYSFNSLSIGTDNALHITWQSTAGQLWIWNVAPNGTITYQDFGPYN